METTTEISTASSPDQVGRSANVIVGAGISMQYGIVQEIKLDETTCDSIIKSIDIAFSPNSIATTWLYTVGQIEAIRDEYIQYVAEIEAGTRNIIVDGNVLPKDIAVARYQGLVNNWQKLLDYHDETTLPHITLCREEAFGLPQDLSFQNAQAVSYTHLTLPTTPYV